MIAIVDYGVGNVGSILNMMRKGGADAHVISRADEIERANKIILPGVGAFDNGMRSLRERGFVPALDLKVKEQGTPILGICLGMQLFGKRSEEGTEQGMAWLDAESVRFRFSDSSPRLKVPHMGWNSVQPSSAQVNGFENGARFYFVHSYHLVCGNPGDVWATTRYGYDFVAAVKRNNIWGVQFHPEKSHKYGLRLLQHFAES